MKLSEAGFSEYFIKMEEEYFSKKADSIRDPKTYNIWHEASFTVDRIISHFIHIAVEQAGRDNLFPMAMALGVDEKSLDNEMKDALLLVVDDETAKSLNGKKDQEAKEYMMKLVSSLSPEQKDKFNKRMDGAVAALLHAAAMNNRAVTDDVISYVKEHNNNVLGDLIPDDSLYDFNEYVYGEHVDAPLYPEETRALKGDDAKFNEILDDIDHILVKGSDESKGYASNYSETLGSVMNRAEADYQKKNMLEDPVYGKVMIMGGNSMTVKKNYDMKERNQAARKALNEKVSVSENKKQDIMEFYDFLDKNGFLDNNPTASAAILLTNAQRDLTSALHSKDKEKIRECHMAYKHAEEATDKALSMLKSISGSGIFPANQSIARVVSIPVKYRKETIGISNLNGFIQVAAACKKANVPFEGFVKDPMHAMKDLWDHLNGKNSPFNKDMYHRPAAELLACMNELPNKDRMKCYAEQNDIAGLERGMKTIAVVLSESDEEASRIEGYFSILQKTFLNDYELSIGDRIFQYCFNGGYSGPMGLIENIIVCNREDRDITRLNPLAPRDDHPEEYFNLDIDTAEEFEFFDREAYLRDGKTSAQEIAMRLVSVEEALSQDQYNIIHKAVKTALGNVFKDIRHTPDASRSMNRVLENIRTLTPENIDPMVFNNVSREASVAKKLREASRSNVAPLKEAVRVVSELRSEYYSHNFFARHLFARYRDMKDSIAMMKNQFTKKGFARKSVEDAVKAYGNEVRLDACMKNLTASLPMEEAPLIKQAVVIEEEKDVIKSEDENDVIVMDEKNLEDSKEINIH